MQHKKVTPDQASVCVQWEYRDWKYQKMGEVAYMQLSLTGKHKTRHRCQNLTVQLKPAGKKNRSVTVLYAVFLSTKALSYKKTTTHEHERTVTGIIYYRGAVLHEEI